MNLLGAVLYDPSTAASKATSALLAMTAFDTTNLRVAVTIPAHGKIYVRIMGGAVTGATTVPTILLGVLNGATVIARITPQDFPGTMNATTQSCPLYAEFVVTGLTPGAMNLDLAYGVEVLVALTTIKYGGPNNTTTNDAWGGISFQVWDPQPMTANSTLTVDTSGRVDVSKVSGTTQTARDLGASVLLSSGTGTGQLDFTSGVVKANLAQILGTALTETAGQIAAAFKKFFDIASPTSTMNTITAVTTTTTVTNQLTAAAIATGVWTDTTAGDFTTALSVGKSVMNGVSLGTGLTVAAVSGAVGSVTGAVGSVTGAVGSVTGNVGGNVVGSVASVTAAVTLPSIPSNWITAAGINAAALNGKGDWNIGKTGYTLTQTFPTNFSALAVTAGGAVTAGTVSDKTGYSLTTSDWAKAGDAMTLTAAYNAAKTAAQAGDAMTLTAAYNSAKTASQAGDAMALTGAERTSIAGVIHTTAIVESYRANGAVPTPAQFMSEVLAHLGESSIAGTTKTVNKLDHATSAATFTLDSAVTPASITRAT